MTVILKKFGGPNNVLGRKLLSDRFYAKFPVHFLEISKNFGTLEIVDFCFDFIQCLHLFTHLGVGSSGTYKPFVVLGVLHQNHVFWICCCWLRKRLAEGRVLLTFEDCDFVSKVGKKRFSARRR